MFQGLNIPNLYSEQMITHIQTVVKFGQHKSDPTGSLLRACGKLLHLELGVGGPLFQVSHHLHPCVTTTWFSQCWYYCVQWGIEISTDLPDLVPQRIHDRELMAIFLQAGFCMEELAMLNHCQMFLNVIFLSDICNGLGTTINNQFWEGV